MKPHEPNDDDLQAGDDDLPVKEIIKAIKGIRYGYVQIIVQDSKVVQIDKTQKTRLAR